MTSQDTRGTNTDRRAPMIHLPFSRRDIRLCYLLAAQHGLAAIQPLLHEIESQHHDIGAYFEVNIHCGVIREQSNLHINPAKLKRYNFDSSRLLGLFLTMNCND